jgi:hypothetical protein
VKQAFNAFILEHKYNVDQSRFLRVIQSVFVQRKKLKEADLYDASFTQIGDDAVRDYLRRKR